MYKLPTLFQSFNLWFILFQRLWKGKPRKELIAFTKIFRCMFFLTELWAILFVCCCSHFQPHFSISNLNSFLILEPTKRLMSAEATTRNTLDINDCWCKVYLVISIYHIPRKTKLILPIASSISPNKIFFVLDKTKIVQYKNFVHG